MRTRIMAMVAAAGFAVGTVGGTGVALARDADTSEVHGGTVARFHDAAACPLPAGVTLSGNWTHGDYVRAVATTHDRHLIRVAARSKCGRPIHPVHPVPPAKPAKAEKPALHDGHESAEKPDAAEKPEAETEAHGASTGRSLKP